MFKNPREFCAPLPGMKLECTFGSFIIRIRAIIIFSCRSQLLDECRLGACYWLSWPCKQISVCAMRFILSHYTNGLDTQDKFACLSITACLTDSISPKVWGKLILFPFYMLSFASFFHPFSYVFRSLIPYLSHGRAVVYQLIHWAAIIWQTLL